MKPDCRYLCLIAWHLTVVDDLGKLCLLLISNLSFYIIMIILLLYYASKHFPGQLHVLGWPVCLSVDLASTGEHLAFD